MTRFPCDLHGGLRCAFLENSFLTTLDTRPRDFWGAFPAPPTTCHDAFVGNVFLRWPRGHTTPVRRLPPAIPGACTYAQQHHRPRDSAPFLYISTGSHASSSRRFEDRVRAREKTGSYDVLLRPRGCLSRPFACLDTPSRLLHVPGFLHGDDGDLWLRSLWRFCAARQRSVTVERGEMCPWLRTWRIPVDIVRFE